MLTCHRRTLISRWYNLFMATEALKERVAALENELMQIKQELAAESLSAPSGWEKMFGIFADSEGFEEATRLGREYRESQHPKEDAEAA